MTACTKTGSAAGWLSTLFVALAFALVACGFTVFVAVRAHVWK